MDDTVVTISATEFKARCLASFKGLEVRKLTRVVVTRLGEPVVDLVPAQAVVLSLRGAHPGSVKVAPGIDLTAPVLYEPPGVETGSRTGDPAPRSSHHSVARQLRPICRKRAAP